MRCRQERGIVLLNILLALSIFAVLLSTVLPAARSIYAHAAVEYEAMCLIGELRRVQAISRTTAMPLYMMERPLSSERAPQIRIRYLRAASPLSAGPRAYAAAFRTHHTGDNGRNARGLHAKWRYREDLEP